MKKPRSKKKPSFFAKSISRRAKKGDRNSLTHVIWPPKGLTPEDFVADAGNQFTGCWIADPKEQARRDAGIINHRKKAISTLTIPAKGIPPMDPKYDFPNFYIGPSPKGSIDSKSLRSWPKNVPHVPPKNLCFESMTRLTVKDLTVRVWRTEHAIGQRREAELMILGNALHRTKVHHSVSDLLNAFAEVKDVSAVEVLNRHGDGALVYCDWPA